MQTKEELIQRLSEYFADTLVECTDHVHAGVITAEDVAKMIFDELEDWMAYHGSMVNAADAIRNALRERVS
jgi:phage gp37-like protein